MNAYRKVLSSHFSDAEIQTLLDIFPYLRDPSNRELGFQLLKGSNLYDSFSHFMAQYAINHKLEWYYESELWDFMFSNKISWNSDNRISKTHIFSEQGNIVLPPFATELDLQVSGVYGYEWVNGDNSVGGCYKITISNVDDIDYPIKMCYYVGDNIECPKTVHTAELIIAGKYDNVTHCVLGHLYKNVPKAIKSITLSVYQDGDKLELGKSLKQFAELGYLEFGNIGNFYNIHNIGFPPSLKEVVSEILYGKEFQQMMLNCINDCPNLTSISLYHAETYKTPKTNEIVQLLENNSFKLLEVGKKMNKVIYQFVKNA